VTDPTQRADAPDLTEEPGAVVEATTPQGRVLIGIPALLARALKWGALLAVAAWAILPSLNETPIVVPLDLMASLPRAPSGWHAAPKRRSDPSRVEVGGRVRFTSSRAWRTYTRGDAEITVDIWDWGGDYPYHLPFDTPGWMNGQEVRVGPSLGRLRYNAGSRSGRLRLRYLDRFYVIVEGEGINESELHAWYGRVDLGRLGAALEKLRSTAASR
jgi:hypothetical protein